MNSMWTVIKKDLKRYFTDKRLLVSLFLPGIIIFTVYNFIGGAIMGGIMGEDSAYVVYAENLPEEISGRLKTDKGMTFSFKEVSSSERDGATALLKSGEIQLYVVFDEDFIIKASEYDVNSGLPAPKVKVYFNSAEIRSESAYSRFSGILNEYEQSIANRFDVNPPTGEAYDVATPEDMSAMIITMVFPMVLLIFLWTGCMMISAEAIAGEKERGTMATLLVTPIKRSDLVFGKILSSGLTALTSSVCSFIGIMLSLPGLFAGMGVVIGSVYNAGTYIALFALILFTVLLFNVLLMIISTLSKSVKEAASWSSAAMLPIMLVSVSTLMGKTATAPLLYLIPVYNTAQCFTALLSLSFDPINFLITIAANAAYILLGAWALKKMFENEKIMFSK